MPSRRPIMNAGLHEFLLRIKSLFRKQRMNRDMTDELEFHQALLRERLLREGVPVASVHLAARRACGNPSRWHESLSELWQCLNLENLLRDIRFSIRLLAKTPG